MEVKEEEPKEKRWQLHLSLVDVDVMFVFKED